MTQRPSQFPDWCTGNPSGIVQPSSADTSAGWSAGQPPPAEYANFLANTTANWLRYLDEQGSSTVLASSLDYSTRLLGGGTWSYSSAQQLAWSANAFIAIPSANDGDNTIPAGNVALPSGSVAYVTANMPFSTSANTTSGSAQLTSVLYGDQVTAGQFVSGPGIPSGATVSTVSSDGSTITLSANATATASGATITFRSGGTLTPAVAVSSTFVPGPNTVVIARALDAGCIVGVGSGQMLLRPTEAKILLGHGFTQTKSFTCGETIGPNMPVYLSPGATGGDIAGTVAGQIYKLDCRSTSSQLRATFLGVCPVGAAAGATAQVVMQGIVNNFSVTPGTVYFGSQATPGIYQAGPPASPGQWVMPLVLGLSTSEVYVLPRNGATQVRADAFIGALNTTKGAYIGGDTAITGNVSSSGSVQAANFSCTRGFRERICLGSYYTNNYQGGEQVLQVANFNASTGATLLSPYPIVFDTSGSIIGVSFESEQALYGAILFVFKNLGTGGNASGAGYEVIRSNLANNAAVGSNGTVSAGTYTIAGLDIAKGQCPVYAGQAYRGYLAYQTAGQVFSGRVHVTVGYDA
jgi:hypothetical protein